MPEFHDGKFFIWQVVFLFLMKEISEGKWFTFFLFI